MIQPLPKGTVMKKSLKKTRSRREAAGPERPVSTGRLEDLERKVHVFEALLRLFEKIGTSFEIERIVKLFLMTVAGQLGLKRTAMYMTAENPARFELCRAFGTGSTPPPGEIGGSSPFVQWLRRKGVRAFIDDYFRSAGDVPSEDMEFLSGMTELELSHACPVESGGEFLGLLFFSGKAGGGGFSDSDGEFIDMLVKVAAITIRNASVYRAASVFRERTEVFARVKRDLLLRNADEMRTPLSVLKSTLWSLDTEDAGGGILVDMSRDAVTRMESRLEQLHALCEVDIEGTQLAMERTDIASLVEECMREFIPELEEKSITVRISDDTGGRELYIDPSKIRIVLRNIVDNAVRSVERGGLIEVNTCMRLSGPDESDGVELGRWYRGFLHRPEGCAAGSGEEYPVLDAISREISFERSDDSSYLEISVTDNGCGIPPEQMGKLSGPIEMIDEGEKGAEERLEAGLSLVAAIITEHGGRLFCRSERGEGSRFAVWLPAD